MPLYHSILHWRELTSKRPHVSRILASCHCIILSYIDGNWPQSARTSGEVLHCAIVSFHLTLTGIDLKATAHQPTSCTVPLFSSQFNRSTRPQRVLSMYRRMYYRNLEVNRAKLVFSSAISSWNIAWFTPIICWYTSANNFLFKRSFSFYFIPCVCCISIYFRLLWFLSKPMNSKMTLRYSRMDIKIPELLSFKPFRDNKLEKSIILRILTCREYQGWSKIEVCNVSVIVHERKQCQHGNWTIE